MDNKIVIVIRGGGAAEVYASRNESEVLVVDMDDLYSRLGNEESEDILEREILGLKLVSEKYVKS